MSDVHMGLLIAALSLGLMAFSIGMLAGGRMERRDERQRITTILRTLGRWCEYEFPVVKDVTRYLELRVNGGEKHIAEFREELRRTYLAPQPHEKLEVKK